MGLLSPPTEQNQPKPCKFERTFMGLEPNGDQQFCDDEDRALMGKYLDAFDPSKPYNTAHALVKMLRPAGFSVGAKTIVTHLLGECCCHRGDAA